MRKANSWRGQYEIHPTNILFSTLMHDSIGEHEARLELHLNLNFISFHFIRIPISFPPLNFNFSPFFYLFFERFSCFSNQR